MNSKSLTVATLALLLPFATIVRAQDSGPYKVLKIQMVGGDGGFDYIYADSVNRNLYVARSGQAGHIPVYNMDTLAQVGDIPNASAHGAAIDITTGHGFATSKPVTMFDAKTFAVIKKIDVEGNPDGYLNDPYNHRFYVLSHAAPNVTVIDGKDGSILGTIDLGGAPEEAATDGHGKIYVDIEDKAAIGVIDANTMKLVGKYDVSSRGGGCGGLALDAKNGILFATCHDKSNMVILSAADGHIITDLPTGVGSDGATFNPATMEAFSSQGDGTITVVKENSPTDFVVEENVPTPARAKTITLDAKTGNLYLGTFEYGPTPAQGQGMGAGMAPMAGGPPQGTAGGSPQGGPGGAAGARRPGPPTIPNSFQILVVGK
jgi:DNA-binding beta-propeller fold protein YncE